ncbi:hypothetical protein KI387_016404, partial [Taxus chinensis]
MFATAIRCFARRRATSRRPSSDFKNPNIPPEDCQIVCRVIHDILREHGPLPVADVWDHVE